MFHKITLIGNVGSDPEMRYTGSGVPVATFSVATKATVRKEKTPDCPEGWKDSYYRRHWELTTWWRVTVWRGLAEICNEFLAKGARVYIEGEIRGEAVDGCQNPRIWTANDGTPRASYEITARTVKFLSTPSRSESEAYGEAPPAGFVEEDAIPF